MRGQREPARLASAYGAGWSAQRPSYRGFLAKLLMAEYHDRAVQGDQCAGEAVRLVRRRAGHAGISGSSRRPSA